MPTLSIDPQTLKTESAKDVFLLWFFALTLGHPILFLSIGKAFEGPWVSSYGTDIVCDKKGNFKRYYTRSRYYVWPFIEEVGTYFSDYSGNLEVVFSPGKDFQKTSVWVSGGINLNDLTFILDYKDGNVLNDHLRKIISSVEVPYSLANRLLESEERDLALAEIRNLVAAKIQDRHYDAVTVDKVEMKQVTI